MRSVCIICLAPFYGLCGIHVHGNMQTYRSNILAALATTLHVHGRGYTMLGALAAGGVNRRAAATVLSLLLAGLLSVLALVTSFSLGRATRRRISEMVQSSGGLAC